jgi:hypothetical protein
MLLTLKSKGGFMKKIIIVTIVSVCAIWLLSGCAWTSYTREDVNGKITVSHGRLFTVNDNIEANVGGSTVKVSGQKIDAATLQYLIKILGAP